LNEKITIEYCYRMAGILECVSIAFAVVITARG